jgi:predicted MFS family arabinose efflux permease
MYRPAASALLIDLVPEHQRAAAFATYRVAFNEGWKFGPATAGFLATHSWTWLFVGDAVTSLLFGVVAWFALPKGVKLAEASRGFIGALGVIRRDRAYLLFLLVLFGPGMLLMQTHAT